MAAAKPARAWSFASPACSGLSLFGALPLPLINYQHLAGATAASG
jgi:hypothetical protein